MQMHMFDFVKNKRLLQMLNEIHCSCVRNEFKKIKLGIENINFTTSYKYIQYACVVCLICLTCKYTGLYAKSSVLRQLFIPTFPITLTSITVYIETI